MSVYVLFGFDMETDMGSYLKSYNGVRFGTDKILSILSSYDLPATFFFTGETAEQNVDVVRKVVRQGHEVGCHSLQHETVGDPAFNMPNDRPILDHEVQPRLQLNKEVVARAAGLSPVSFRAPRLWQGQAQITALESLGFLVDASYSFAVQKTRLIPYHPAKQNWLDEGDLKLLEIPNFAFVDENHDYGRYFGRNDQWPLLRLEGADFVFQKIQHVIQGQVELCGHGILLFYLHPWEYVSMPERYEYDEGTFLFKPELYFNCGDVMEREFESLVIQCMKAGYEFITCRDFREVWKEIDPTG